MNSRAKKITPLFFILLMTMSVFTYTPTATTSNTTPAPQIQVNHNPAISYWANNSAAYAIYNGHWSEWRDDYYSGWSKKDIIMTAQLSVVPNAAKTVSNLTISVYEFFTGLPELGMEGLWYNVSTSTGGIVDMKNPTSGHLGNYSFLYVKTMSNLNVGDYVDVTAPFEEDKSINFYVNMTETVLGIETKQLFTSVYVYIDYGMGETYTRDSKVSLWISNNTQGLLMRMTGYDSEDYTGSDWYHRRLEMSVEIGQTNILDLILPSIPKGIVPWMKTGKYIQYNLQGSGYVDARFTNHTGSVTWQLPGDTRFRTTISANLTLKVERGTTAYVDPYRSTRYVWVLHLMLNNTNLQLPDLRRTIQYLNSTGIGVPLEAADFVLAQLAPFNHTGLVADTWFLVDNASGQMYWPGVHFSSLAGFSPSTTETLGDLLSQGLGLQILSWFAQSYMYQGWGFSNPPETKIIHQVMPGSYETVTLDGTLDASIACVGTEYLSFPGGGGGHTWRINANVNGHVTASSIVNRSYGPPGSLSFGGFMSNSTNDITSNGYLNIERTSGFPLAFGLDFRFTTSGEPRYLPYYWYSTFFDVFLSLTAKIPKTNIWFSNPPVNLILGVGNNATSPDSTFGDYGFDVWTNGADDVVVTSSASAPPDSTSPPSGTLPFVYLDIQGVKLPGATQIILYVFYNRTRVQALGISENSLKLYTYNMTTHSWNALETTRLALNSTHGVLFAVLPHLSYFAVLGTSAGVGAGIPTLYIIIAAVAVIVVLAAVVYIRKGKGSGGLK